MKVKVTVKPNSKFEKIEEDFEGNLKIWVKEPPKEGKANYQIVKLIAKYYKVPKGAVKITKGKQSKFKIIVISNHE